MTIACFLLGAALVVAPPTNAPASFSTEVEQTFSVPDITERNVWLDCGVDFSATSSNRIEIAFGPDVNGDGLLGDDESPLSFAIDCGRIVLRDGHGNELHSTDVVDDLPRLTLVPAKGHGGDTWSVSYVVDDELLIGGVFPEGTPSVKTWNLARVRMNGPDATTTRVILQKNRLATVFIIR